MRLLFYAILFFLICNIPALSEQNIFTVVKNNDLVSTKALLKSAGNVNTKNIAGETPLHIAAQNGNIKIMESLLKNGADINAKTNDFIGEDADYYGYTPLHMAIVYDQKDAVLFLVEHGANIELTDAAKQTPLLIAARKRNGKDILQILLNKGANLYVKDSFNNNILLIAAQEGYPENIKFLLDKGLPLEVTNNNGETALHLARVHAAAIELLLDRGANIEARDNEGETPLHKAVRYQSLDAVKVLLDKGARVNIRNNKGETPLFLAAYWYDAAKVLLEYQADPKIPDNDGLTAQEKALQIKKPEVVKLFKGAQAPAKKKLQAYLYPDEQDLFGLGIKDEKGTLVKVIESGVAAPDESGYFTGVHSWLQVENIIYYVKHYRYKWGSSDEHGGTTLISYDIEKATYQKYPLAEKMAAFVPKGTDIYISEILSKKGDSILFVADIWKDVSNTGKQLIFEWDLVSEKLKPSTIIFAEKNKDMENIVIGNYEIISHGAWSEINKKGERVAYEPDNIYATFCELYPSRTDSSSTYYISKVKLIGDTVYVFFSGDTSQLTERMGSNGARENEVVILFALNEDKRIKKVYFDLIEGSHFSPGLAQREHFLDMYPTSELIILAKNGDKKAKEFLKIRGK
ncbi:MAG: ankyrin repeat domain-containing protein [Candidatus Margulisbacteria bacterium]|nr:ankyrin repeat domain-containing protein [Candidatus Margulisiibacteriota bacterium]